MSGIPVRRAVYRTGCQMWAARQVAPKRHTLVAAGAAVERGVGAAEEAMAKLGATAAVMAGR
eukprot:5803119-Prymnesium_polylepis.1